jgi:hypothetical protein
MDKVIALDDDPLLQEQRAEAVCWVTDWLDSGKAGRRIALWYEVYLPVLKRIHEAADTMSPEFPDYARINVLHDALKAIEPIGVKMPDSKTMESTIRDAGVLKPEKRDLASTYRERLYPAKPPKRRARSRGTPP